MGDVTLTIRTFLAALTILLAACAPVASAPGPQEAQGRLLKALQNNSDLYQACLQNIENQFTPGYKCSDIFGWLESPQGRQLRLRFTQGKLYRTDNPLDLAIQGQGFFPLENGLVTRAGCFQYSYRTGTVRTTDNLGLLGLKPGSQQLEIVQVPSDCTSIEVGPDGLLTWVHLEGDGKPEVGYQLQLVSFPSPEYGLVRKGQHFSANPKAGLASRGTPGKMALGVIAQGHLELSNVNVYEQELVAGALRRYAGLMGFPVSTELWDDPKKLVPTSQAVSPQRDAALESLAKLRERFVELKHQGQP